MLFEVIVAAEAALVLAALYVVYSFTVNKVLSPLRTVPGPWYCALGGLYYQLKMAKGIQLPWIQRLHEKYGPVVRVAPNVISMRDVDAAHTIFATHRFIKGPIYHGFDLTGSENIFSARDPAFFKIRKKLAVPMFTRTAVEEMDDMIMAAGITPLMARLDRHAEAGDAIDIMGLFHYMTFDVIGDIAFGRNFNLIEDDNNGDNMVTWLAGTAQLGIYKLALGPLANQWLMPKLFECQRKIIDFTVESVRIRRATPSTRPDSLNKFLVAMKDEKIEQLSDMDIAGDILLQLMAGTDSTATCCAWTIYRLKNEPEVYARLLAELREAIPDINMCITHAMVRNLPYLTAVINESLRIYPVAGGDPHRVVPKGGVEFCGKYLPAGTVVMASQQMLNYWDKIWDEPTAFRPERWLIKDEERLNEMKRAFYPFSMGVRSCIGRDLAWMEMHVTLASVLRRYEVEILPNNDMEPVFNLVVLPRGHALNVKLVRRAD
ncbi:cytochrome P450 [Thamnocephalis sphaerospora]|uniref:Cytochrome P450 n=1 Tax=Thamnocephalis sphaerospora TaxID=78915 RepID=A0A4P9XJQ4_9FUNG|nr:cytochrome P450 [Thamnocephalis sphaerospora]|eukprot:RKP05956.1 cytochrome P450 [Thamnocephalis sphaerospora]